MNIEELLEKIQGYGFVSLSGQNGRGWIVGIRNETNGFNKILKAGSTPKEALELALKELEN